MTDTELVGRAASRQRCLIVSQQRSHGETGELAMPNLPSRLSGACRHSSRACYAALRTSVTFLARQEGSVLRMSRRQAGFTLLELMIVVAIIAILSAIAYPQYTQYITRSKLVDGMNGLSAYRVSMEQYYQDNRQYACPATGPAYPTSQYFTYSCTVAADASGNPAQTFLAKATANANTPMNGLVYSIDNTNTRQTVSVPAGWTQPTTNCWSTTKGGC